MELSWVFLCLGNPGARYAHSRHNVGFDFAEALAARCGVALRKPFFRPYQYTHLSLADSSLLLCKPLTFMNRSGSVLPLLARRYAFDHSRVVVVTDNVDLSPGVVRFKRSGGSSTHNGLRSVIAALDTTDFPRLYIGVGRPPDPTEIVEHVLSTFATDDRLRVDAAVTRVVDLLCAAPVLDTLTVMTRINDTVRS